MVIEDPYALDLALDSAAEVSPDKGVVVDGREYKLSPQDIDLAGSLQPSCSDRHSFCVQVSLAWTSAEQHAIAMLRSLHYAHDKV